MTTLPLLDGWYVILAAPAGSSDANLVGNGTMTVSFQGLGPGALYVLDCLGWVDGAPGGSVLVQSSFLDLPSGRSETREGVMQVNNGQ